MIQNPRYHAAARACFAFVQQLSVDRNVRTLSAPLAAHKSAPLRNVQRIGLRKPGMAVDARTLVIPPLIERGIHANGHDILAAVFDIIRYVEAERCVAAKVSPSIEEI